MPPQASNLPTATSEPRASSVAPNSSTTNTSFNAPTETQGGSAPRDAAAAAALRRLNSGASSSSSISDATTSTPSPVPGTRQGNLSAVPSAPTNYNSTSSVPTNGAPSVPMLIPLTDFGAMSRGPFINSSFLHQPMTGFAGAPTNAATAEQNGINPLRSQNTRHQPPNPLQTQTSSFPFASSVPQGSSSSSDPSQQQQGSSLWSQLPHILTEDQLLRMDVLTREAIDERLRVLGRVDEVLNMCIEELTRVKSVLPPTRSASSSGAANGVTPLTNGVSAETHERSEVPSGDESSKKVRGKEKASEPILVDESESDSVHTS